jgi:hypothetical protein
LKKANARLLILDFIEPKKEYYQWITDSIVENVGTEIFVKQLERGCLSIFFTSEKARETCKNMIFEKHGHILKWKKFEKQFCKERN